jgi:extradiol dioxygenase family protein
MSGLAALLAGRTPPDVYLWHNAARVDDVAHAVEKADWRFGYVDGWTIEDKDTFGKALGAALDLDDDGAGLEGVEAHLEEVTAQGHKGVVLLWEGWSPLARADEPAFAEALRALGSRAHGGTGDKLAVLLRGEGPAIEVPELPDGPH